MPPAPRQPHFGPLAAALRATTPSWGRKWALGSSMVKPPPGDQENLCVKPLTGLTGQVRRHSPVLPEVIRILGISTLLHPHPVPRRRT